MDTRYWGPSGWKLLHSISFSVDLPAEKDYKDFFYAIAFVLPCKYCRKSYSEYIRAIPITQSPKWLWKIHNCVNKKLRSQRLCTYDDPPFSDVKKIYEEKLQQGCSRVHFEGWEFLFSVVEGHPLSKLSMGSKPFDPTLECETELERNINNSCTAEERMIYYKQFWKLLPSLLPFPEWRSLWKKYDNGAWDTRAEALKNLYSIRCSLEKELELENKTKFSSLCQELRKYKSGCNKSVKSKTCRKKKPSAK